MVLVSEGSRSLSTDPSRQGRLSGGLPELSDGISALLP